MLEAVVAGVAVLLAVVLLAGVLGPLRRRGHRSLDGPADRAGLPPASGPQPGSEAPGRESPAGPSAAATPGTASPEQEAAALQGELKALVRRVNAAGGRLPVGAVPGVRAVEDVLRPLLTYVQRQSASPEELRQLTALVRQYLPEAVDHYLALPASYTATATSATGRTPAQELLDQLQLLHEGAGQLAQAVYDSDAQALAVGRRFLDAKFRRSDLDL
jgi:hypothetical protein